MHHLLSCLSGFVFHLFLWEFSFAFLARDFALFIFIWWWVEYRFAKVDDVFISINLCFTSVEPKIMSIICLTIMIGIIGGVLFEVCD
jgi:cell division protein FtsX